MSVSQFFQDFSSNLIISKEKRESVAYRTARLTRQLNSDFRATDSDSANRFYSGSYGRNTAIPTVSDIDLIYVLPSSLFTRFNNYASAGQSALLQAVRMSINNTYPNSAIVADGQIVCLSFVDGMKFEIVPVFTNQDGSYTYADANLGGSWKVCKPKHEIDAFQKRDVEVNRNLVELGRMARAWRDANNVPMSGMLIDTLAYQFISTWPQRDKSYLYYDWLTRDFFAYLAALPEGQNYWLAPGSGSYAWKTGSFNYKARQAELRAREAIDHLQRDEMWSAKQKYREIYGPAFPA